MKNFLLVSNIALIALVVVLFYLHFSSAPKKAVAVQTSSKSAPATGFKIAYFEMDSIENNYEYLKDVRNQLKTKEQALTSELNQMKNSYMQEVNKFNQQAQTMSQEQAGTVQQQLMQKQKRIQEREQAMGADMQDVTFKKMQEVNKTIEGYLKEYNGDKGYSYILGYQPGTIYYKDSTYDITADVLKGLNEGYKKKD
jgi:outer membrane protein